MGSDHNQKEGPMSFWMPFVLLFLGMTFMILISDLDKPKEEKSATNNEAPAH